MSTNYEPTPEQVERVQQEVKAYHGGECPRGTARFILKRQHEREKGLLEALRRLARTPWDGINHSDCATAALDAHARLDAPPEPSLLDVIAKTEPLPGQTVSVNGQVCVLVPRSQWNGLMVAVERAERAK